MELHGRTVGIVRSFVRLSVEVERPDAESARVPSASGAAHMRGGGGARVRAARGADADSKTGRTRARKPRASLARWPESPLAANPRSPSLDLRAEIEEMAILGLLHTTVFLNCFVSPHASRPRVAPTIQCTVL